MKAKAKAKNTARGAGAAGEFMNQTGMAVASDADAMRETAAQFRPKGKEKEFREMRQQAREGLPPIGTVPPPASLGGVVRDTVRRLTGAQTTVLLDKIGERLAFERTGTRLYETLLEKLDGGASFEGGPTRADLEHIRDEEAAHFHMLHERMLAFDGDPTAITPSANITAVTSMGVVAVVSDARTNLAESLEAILVAELADRDGWLRLIELAEQSGDDDFASDCRKAEQQEQEHLENVRSWLSAYGRVAAGEDLGG